MAKGAAIDPVVLEHEASKAKAQHLAFQLEDCNFQKFHNEKILKANQKNDKKITIPNKQLTHKDQKQKAIIKPEVHKLI